MPTTQYIGSRYVPLLADPVEWSITKEYEPLTIVTHEGNSYTSRQFVPKGIDIANEAYWALTGNYNAQIEQYRRETAQAVERTDEAVGQAIEHTDAAVNQVDEWLTDAQNKYGAKPFAFDTVADMQAAYALFYVGAICHTNGFHESGDGGAAWYVITETGTANDMDVLALQSGLLATLVITEPCVAPEQFGAWGDNTHDDTNILQYVINTYEQVTLNNKYKITNPLTIPDYHSVVGHGYIYSSDSCFEIDGKNHIYINGLQLRPSKHGIYIHTTTNHANYNTFENIFMISNESQGGTGTCGIKLEVVNKYLTEETFNSCVMWGFDYGIHLSAPSSSPEIAMQRFNECSTETSKIAGQYLKNASEISFINCRHVEVISNKFVTEGTCNRLMILGGVFENSSAATMQLSSDTNGIIIGRYRSGGVYASAPGVIANIVNGATVPLEDYCYMYSDVVSGDYVMPSAQNINVLRNFRYTSSADATMTLDPRYYGGVGRINEIFIYIGGSAGTLSLVNGTITKQLTNTSGSGKTYMAKYNVAAYNTPTWSFFEVSA